MNYKNKQLWLLILLRNNYPTKIQICKNATIRSPEVFVEHLRKDGAL